MFEQFNKKIIIKEKSISERISSVVIWYLFNKYLLKKYRTKKELIINKFFFISFMLNIVFSFCSNINFYKLM